MESESLRRGKLKEFLSNRRDDDVPLNQPGRALARSILWALAGVGCALFPLGALSLLLGYIPGAVGIAENLAGLLLSGFISLLIFIFLVLVVIVFSPVLSRGSLPRVVSKRPQA